MSLGELVDGLAPQRPDWLACTPRLVPRRDERDPPSPKGVARGEVNPRAALVAPRNEGGDDGSPAGALGGEAVNPFPVTH